MRTTGPRWLPNLLSRGFRVWTTQREIPWAFRETATVVPASIAAMFVLAALVLWISSDNLGYFPLVVVGAVAVAASQLSAKFIWERTLPWNRAAQEMEAWRIDFGDAGGATRATIVAVQMEELPSLVWSSDDERTARSRTIASQPFVVSSGAQAWIVDTPFLHVEGGEYVSEARAWHARVGDTVVFMVGETTKEPAPAWASTALESANYRDRHLRRLEASELNPTSLLILPRGEGVER